MDLSVPDLNWLIPGKFIISVALKRMVKLYHSRKRKMDCEDGCPLESSLPPSQSGGGYTEEEQVMSEVHLGCPPSQPGPHYSHFTILLPPGYESVEDSLISRGANAIEVDEDGDLILTRRHDPPKNSFVITIQHHITSSIPRVGLQVWRAEMVLADFVLHMMYKSSKIDGIVAVELGAGTGLVGMLLARVAKTVFITDTGEEVLENCLNNINLNAGVFRQKASVCVRELDWKCPWPPQPVVNSPSQPSHGWSISEVEELQRASLLVAADVIYSDDLTDAFFTILEAIMSNHPEKVLYLALEKRYNFSIDDLDVVANGYSQFRSYLKDEDDFENELSCGFIGRRINLAEIPQYVKEYNRGNDVEIWQIKYVKTKKS